MQVDPGENEQRVVSLVILRQAALGVMNASPHNRAAVALLTTCAKVDILVRTIVEAHGLDYADTLVRLYEQPYCRCHFDAHHKSENPGLSEIDVIEWGAGWRASTRRCPSS